MSTPDTFLAGNGVMARAFYTVMRALVVGLFRLYNRITVEGADRIPTEGAFILAPVHRSILDTPYAACVTRRRMRFMAKDSIWNSRIFGWIVSALGAFPVTRETADREALRRAITVLGAGEPLVMFPEGGRRAGPRIEPLFNGAAYVAAKAGVPIVPVGIGGSERVMPKGAWFIWPRKVRVVVGAPLAPPIAADGGRVKRQERDRYTAQLTEALQAAFDASMDGVGWSYDEVPQPLTD
ncbi:MAG: hypothetical protein CSA55_01570 [Ilumatobacter coccineus]|uniref:Phospholipid/glycerol acyltransferase domain-containing protein n=1 Tax=Ilumatobacter coccineus TaxID=467094 RepID=A0A2G6KF12_9ACTN|nr:MAG: hypothetical protein CSA55_01570 [Ilumatobacter coccineus]